MALPRLLFELAFLLRASDCFNLEASRPIVYEAPGSGAESDYFGMSVAIRPTAASSNDAWTVQIGAPRGRGGSGAVYRCRTRGPCRAFAPDEGSSAVGGQGAREFREKKDAAWIGVAMDVALVGSGERSAVCGHRWMNQNLRNPENVDVTYLVTGVCYLQDLLPGGAEAPSRRLLPLADKDEIYAPKPYAVDLSTYRWGLGQAGISVKLAEEPPSLLIGAPGVTHWIGSVVRYDRRFDVAVADFARTEIARRSRYLYSGYSVTFGRFYEDGELWYAAGAPRGANYRGEVFTFRYKGSSGDVRLRSNLVGATFGEYFGSSLATSDLDGDGFHDLIVGAPLFSSRDPDEGRIYVYLGTGKGDFLVPAQIVNGRASRGRFGSCVASVGDLDQDGYGDVAVGAPYEGDNEGAVYVYGGFSNGLRTSPAQRIRASDVHPLLRGFGISISSAVDVDGNKFADVAAGAYLSGHVVLMRSRPVISLHPAIGTEDVGLVDRKASHFNVTVCSRYAGPNAPDHVDVVRTIDVDPLRGRGKLDPRASARRKSIRLRADERTCEIHPILLDMSSEDFSPLQITVRNEIASCGGGRGSPLLVRGEEAREAEEFPKSCPVGREAETSKEVAFAGVCGPDLECRSDLELSCAVDRFRGGTYVLGSAEILALTIEAKNGGEPALDAKIKIWSNLKLKRRGRNDDAAGEAPAQTHWLFPEGVLAENYKTDFLFEIDSGSLAQFEEGARLHLTVQIFTSSSEANPENDSCKLSAKLLSDALLNFYASSSAAGAYASKAAPSRRTLDVTHYYEVQKTGRSPLKDVRLTLYVPFYFKRELLTFEVETSEWMHSSRHADKKTPLRNDLEENTEKGICPPTNRTLFFNCSTAENECAVLKIFFTKGIPAGFSSYVKILMTLNVSALDLEKTEKDIVYLSTTGVLEFSKFLGGKPQKIRRSASTSLFDEDRESGVDARVIALSVLAGGFLLSLAVTALAKGNFFDRAKKEQLKALRDADASFVYFAAEGN